mgnify:CR=1 FL=1|jgi:hypothetical protein
MPAYTDNTDSPIAITEAIKTLRVIAVGEGGAGTSYNGCTGTNGDDGADTTFMGITASGGTAASSFTKGTGSGATATAGTILSSSTGEDGTDGTLTGTIGTGGAGHTFTSSSLGSITKGGGEDGSGTSVCRSTWFIQTANQCSSGCPATNGGGYLLSCQQVDVVIRQCNYYRDYPYKGGGGGAGGFIEVQFSQSELTSYYGSQSYSVNSSGSGELNGFLEVIYFFTEVYIKTSSGWQLVKNIYVKQSDVDVGWTTSVATIKNHGW